MLLTKAEVKKFLRISEHQFNRLLDEKMIDYVQYVPKGNRYVTQEALDEFITNHTVRREK